MPAKQIIFRQAAHTKLLAGINTLAQAVRVTLGPKARTVVLERAYGSPVIINSGVVVAKEIEPGSRSRQNAQWPEEKRGKAAAESDDNM